MIGSLPWPSAWRSSACMLAAHWWWGEFLLSPLARNWFFGVDQWDYYMRVGEWRYQFWNTVPDMATIARGLGIAVASAIVTSRDWPVRSAREWRRSGTVMRSCDRPRRRLR